jgi:hypothetical protein
MVAFRDTSVEQALVSHVFVMGLLGPMMLSFALTTVTVACLAYVARRRGHSWLIWLWPHRGLSHIYQSQSAAFLALLLVGAGIYLKSGSVTVFLLTPVVAMGLGVGIHWIGARQQGPRGSLTDPRWQRLTVLLFLACLIIVPSAALFRVALSQQFAKLILTEQEWIAAQRDDLQRATRFETIDGGYGVRRVDDLLNARQRYAACVPAPFGVTSGTEPFVQRFTRCGAEVAEEAGAADGVLQPAAAGDTVLAALQWLYVLLPIDNDILVRQRFQDYRQTYSPAGTIVSWFRASEIAFVGFVLTLGLLVWWIGWNTNRLFLADLDESGSRPSGSLDDIWDGCSADEHMVLMQIARERIANPYQRPIVEGLLKKGLLRFDPDVQPFSSEFDQFLHAKEQALQAEVQHWERVNARHSWRHGRLILAAAVGGVGLFLFATQPGLQFNVVGVASGITGVLTAGFKFRDAVMAWLGQRKSDA